MNAAASRDLLVILGNQLFPPGHLPNPRDVDVFMAEDMGLCTYVRHHQQKIVLFLAAMRHYAERLKEQGYAVHYHLLDHDRRETFEQRLRATIGARGYRSLRCFEVEDRPMEQRLAEFADEHGLSLEIIRSPMFLCGRDEFAAYADERDRLLMADFYRRQRGKLGLMVDDDGRPEGGQWSFDSDNRKRLPRDVEPPPITAVEDSRHVRAVRALVEEVFASHPGSAAEFCWPVTREAALSWLDDFIEERLADFGPYEDAITQRSDTVFHSLLSPSLNIGLLTPQEVVDKVMAHAAAVPLQSLEGFIRQIIGWREFVRGIYRQFGERQQAANFWGHGRRLGDAWFTGETGLPPLDDTIRTAVHRGWTHHIPRLMVLGNLMTLCEIEPAVAHDWFMEHYVDSSEWVMGPNVYGMGLFSDGGIFATKPYICGSNYLLKMSDYKRGDWCDTVDGLYWRFIDKHRDFFAGNPRLALMPRALDRLGADRKEKIFDRAERFLEDHTC